jgi:hypothetical protein
MLECIARLVAMFLNAAEIFQKQYQMKSPWCGNIARANGFITITPVEQND